MKILVLHNIFVEPGMALSKKTGYPFFTIKTYTPDYNDILILFGAHNAGELLIKLRQKHNVNYIIMQSEQLNSVCFNLPFYKELLQSCLVFDWSYLNIKLLKTQHDIKCKNIFSWCFLKPSEISLDMNIAQNYDIFFAGVRTRERETLILRLKRLNPKLKWFVDLDYRLTDYQRFTKIISRCKYVINIPAYKGSALETHRIIKGLYSGCQVLSEPSEDIQLTKELTPYVHFGHLDNLIQNIEFLEKKDGIDKYIKNYEAPKIQNLKNEMEMFKCDTEIQNAVDGY
tara:strand:- start:971 stop:1825 length:855 start_codon:yes stop_codon:yes gene_type:complete